MSVTCVVQARTGSARFPGKVLADIGGQPMLAFLLRRLAPLRPDHMVVATTTDQSDDLVADAARAEGAEVLRGPENDVLARYALALEQFPASSVVRITADCPLADAGLVRAALAVQSATGADYVSNTLVRTFPDGLDVEVIAADALRAANAEAVDPVESEHVTPFLYRRPERFALRSLRHNTYLGHLRWTVDTPDDLARVRQIVERVGRADAGWEEALSAVEVPPPAIGGRSFLPATAGDGRFVLSLRNEPSSIRWSRSPRPVDPGEHREWLAALLDNPGSRLWIARVGNQAIGQARVDVRDGVGKVSFAVEAGHRERGLGGWILEQLEAALGADEQVHTLAAEVHRDNEASQRLFAAAGYREVGRDGEFVIMRRERAGRSALR